MNITDQSIPRLDRSKPPPGFDIAVLPRPLQGTVITAGVWGPNALKAAWAHYEREHDPPGLAVERIHDEAFHVRGMARLEAWYTPSDARAAAWAWYWTDCRPPDWTIWPVVMR